MEFRVLGTLEIRDGVGRLLAPPRRKQRLLLAVLLLRVNTPVSTEMLLDLLWPEAAPSSARANLQSYVSDLRRLLHAAEPADPPRLPRVPGGYLLRAGPQELDATVFEALVGEGRQALAERRHAFAAERLGQALARWRGPVLEDLPLPAALQPEAERWEELRMMVLEDSVEARLGLAEPAMLAAELAALTARYPLRERLWAHLMLALYRAGRQADALDAYLRVYRLLDQELGVQPGQALQQLHQQILAADPTLDAPADRGTTDVPVPRQLPAGFGDFTGRTEILDRLDALLPSISGVADTAVVISAIAGGAGVGKTALAVHWAHRVKDWFPDGQLSVNLRGFDPSGQAIRPDEAVRGFLEALGTPRQRIPADPQAQVGLYRSLMAGKRALVLLDNARDAEQVRPLLPGAGGCLVVVTSRNQLPGLIAAQGAHPVILDVLTGDEARQLLARRIGRDRLAAEPGAANEIIASCARLPLALAIAAARAATHPHLPLATLAAELRDSRARLDVLSGADCATDLRAVFSWSYRALDVGAARLFRLLGLHPDTDIGVPAAASLAGVTLGEARSLLAELCHAHLLAERASGRFSFHDLLRAYAAELAQVHDTDAERHATVHRILDHYLGTAHAAALLLNPHRDHPIVLTAPQAGVTPEDVVDHRRASAWVATERAALLACVDLAASSGFDTHAWQLTWALAGFLARTGHWHEWVSTQRVALQAVERLGDRVEQARAHRGLARAYRQLGRFHDAHTHLRYALRLYGELGDHVGEGHTHNSLGQVYELQGRHGEALGQAEHALKLLRRANDLAGEALALNAVGWCHARLGNYQQALTHCQQALDLQQKLGDQVGEATSWDSLGYIRHHLGDHREAVSCYQHSLALRHDGGDRYSEAKTLIRLGDTRRDAGDDATARDAWRQAAAILDDLSHPDADDVRARLRQLDPVPT